MATPEIDPNRPVCRPGMRVRLARGTSGGFGPDGLQQFELWVAGKVPVGKVGTLYLGATTHKAYRPLSIKWDGVSPRPRLDRNGKEFEFGLGAEDGDRLPAQFEEAAPDA